jgi:hypothetical protein
MRTDPLCQRGRQHAFDGRAVDTGLLEGGAIGQHPAHPATAPWPIPPVFPECPTAIQRREELSGLVVELLDP